MCIHVFITLFAILYTKSGPEIENVVTREKRERPRGHASPDGLRKIQTPIGFSWMYDHHTSQNWA
jgi:hypothetical protein